MWRQHQNLNRQLPHLARIPRVLYLLSEMHMGDNCAGPSPADLHQLQPALRPGGPGVQVSVPAGVRACLWQALVFFEALRRVKALSHKKTKKHCVLVFMETNILGHI